MRIKHIICFLALIFPSVSFADTIGVWLGGGVWDWSISGNLRYSPGGGTTTEADVKNDLHLTDDTSGFGYVAIEHPVPIIPNVRISATGISSTGTGNTTVQFTYGNTTYNVNETLTTELTLDQTDVTLYYEILDNVVGLDIGLNAKSIDGRARISGTSGIETNDIDAIIPMLYAAIDIPLPFGFSIGGNGAAVSYDGSSISDFNAYVRYSSAFYLGAEVGYRSQEYKLDDIDGSYGNVKFSGPYAGLYLYF